MLDKHVDSQYFDPDNGVFCAVKINHFASLNIFLFLTLV